VAGRLGGSGLTHEGVEVGVPLEMVWWAVSNFG